MAEQLQVLSLNVRGLGDSKKRREIFRWLKRFHNGGNSITLLQETHSQEGQESIWLNDWGSKIYFSHGTSNARGVAILMPMQYDFEVKELWKDTEGRTMAISLIYDLQTVDIINIYAPTKDKIQNQIDFLKNIDQNLNLAESTCILGGDFNTYMDPKLDKKGGIIEQKTKYSEKLVQMLAEYNINDMWRILNPNKKQFTWRQKKPFIQSRLDYFLISGELFYNIYEMKIKPAIKTDHSLIQMKINLVQEQKRGPGFWKFNTALLKDEVYIDMIKEIIEQLKTQYSDIENLGLKWDLIKTDIRRITIDYSKTQSNIRKQVEDDLQKQYVNATEKCELDPTNKNIAILENIKEQLETLNAFKTAGAHIRSKAKHVEENERSTKYFLNIEKRNYKMKHIKWLNQSG